MADKKLILPSDPGFMTPEEVNLLHAFDDVDKDPNAHHHTLGPTANQAAPGNHKHVAGTQDTITLEWDRQTQIASGPFRRTFLASNIVVITGALNAGAAETSGWRHTISGLPTPATGNATQVDGVGIRSGGLFYGNRSLVYDSGSNLWFLVPDGGNVASGDTWNVVAGDILQLHCTFSI